MKISDMSDKTKEEHAAYLLKFSCNMMTAFYVTVIVAPLGMIMALAIKEPNSNTTSFENIFSLLSGWHGVVFLVLEVFVYFLALTSQNKAQEIYNLLYPNKSKH